jgi:putative ABC transport system permease protein
VLTITLRDLQFRRRQFAIAIVGAALVFALVLILTGISAGFRTESEATVEAAGADAWIVPEGVEGPFSSISSMPAETATDLRGRAGVDDAAPLVAMPHVADVDGESITVNVIGVSPEGLGSPDVAAGRPLARSGQAVVDEAAGAGTGSTVAVAGRDFTVVGAVEGRTYRAGVPVVYVPLADAQALAYNGRPLANAVLVAGDLGKAPAGLSALTEGAVVDDMLKPLEGATRVIDILRILMWVVAGVIIGAVIYLSALERIGDFAVLKAVGGESRSLAAGLAAQSVLASLLAAGLGSVIALALRPAFPLPVTIHPSAFLVLAAIAGVVGVIASFAALRRVLKVDPALAFAG